MVLVWHLYFTNTAVSPYNPEQLIQQQDNCWQPLRLRCEFPLPWIGLPELFGAPILRRIGITTHPSSLSKCRYRARRGEFR